MEEVKELHALRGSFINLTYVLPNGQRAKFWDDNKIYLKISFVKKTATGVTESLLTGNISW